MSFYYCIEKTKRIPISLAGPHSHFENQTPSLSIENHSIWKKHSQPKSEHKSNDKIEIF